MRKKIGVWVLLVMAWVGLSGCESIPKKFIRKKKEPKHIAAVIPLEQGPYQKKFSNDYYYKTHFTLWRGWHEDLLNQWGGNRKKVMRAAQESQSELSQMGQYLQPEKQAQLKPVLNSLTEIVRKIEDGQIASQEAMMRYELEKIQRDVNNNFYYDKVKESVLQDTVDLGQSSTPSAAAASK
jgi:hypothetical protein